MSRKSSPIPPVMLRRDVPEPPPAAATDHVDPVIVDRVRFNNRLVIVTLVLLGTVVAGVYIAHKLSVRRTAGMYLTQARDAQSQGKYASAINFYSRFLRVAGDVEVDPQLVASLVELAPLYRQGVIKPEDGPRLYGLYEIVLRNKPDERDLRWAQIDVGMRIARARSALDHIAILLSNRVPSEDADEDAPRLPPLTAAEISRLHELAGECHVALRELRPAQQSFVQAIDAAPYRPGPYAKLARAIALKPEEVLRRGSDLPELSGSSGTVLSEVFPVRVIGREPGMRTATAVHRLALENVEQKWIAWRNAALFFVRTANLEEPISLPGRAQLAEEEVRRIAEQRASEIFRIANKNEDRVLDAVSRDGSTEIQHPELPGGGDVNLDGVLTEDELRTWFREGSRWTRLQAALAALDQAENLRPADFPDARGVLALAKSEVFAAMANSPRNRTGENAKASLQKAQQVLADVSDLQWRELQFRTMQVLELIAEREPDRKLRLEQLQLAESLLRQLWKSDPTAARETDANAGAGAAAADAPVRIAADPAPDSPAEFVSNARLEAAAPFSEVLWKLTEVLCREMELVNPGDVAAIEKQLADNAPVDGGSAKVTDDNVLTAMRAAGVQERFQEFVKCRLLVFNRQWREASGRLAALQYEVAGTPLEERVLLMRAQCASGLENPDSTMRLSRELVDANPVSVMGKRLLARSLAQVGRLEEAIDQMRQCLGIPGALSEWTALRIQQQMGKLPAARDFKDLANTIDSLKSAGWDEVELAMAQADVAFARAVTAQEIAGSSTGTVDPDAAQFLAEGEQFLETALASHPEDLDLLAGRVRYEVRRFDRAATARFQRCDELLAAWPATDEAQLESMVLECTALQLVSELDQSTYLADRGLDLESLRAVAAASLALLEGNAAARPDPTNPAAAAILDAGMLALEKQIQEHPNNRLLHSARIGFVAMRMDEKETESETAATQKEIANEERFNRCVALLASWPEGDDYSPERDIALYMMDRLSFPNKPVDWLKTQGAKYQPDELSRLVTAWTGLVLRASGRDAVIGMASYNAMFKPDSLQPRMTVLQLLLDKQIADAVEAERVRQEQAEQQRKNAAQPDADQPQAEPAAGEQPANVAQADAGQSKAKAGEISAEELNRHWDRNLAALADLEVPAESRGRSGGGGALGPNAAYFAGAMEYFKLAANGPVDNPSPETVLMIQSARQYLELAAQARPSWSTPRRLLADLDTLAGRPNESIEQLKRAYQLGDKSEAVLVRLILDDLKDQPYTDAQRLVREGLDSIRGELSEQFAKLSVLVASTYDDNRDEQRLIEEVYRRHPIASVTDRLATVMTLNEQDGAAIEVLREQLAEVLAPDEPFAWVNLVRFYAQRGRFPKALEKIELARTRLPADKVAATIGLCYEELARFDPSNSMAHFNACVASLEEAVKSNPEAGLQLLAKVYIGWGQREQALATVARLLDPQLNISAGGRQEARRIELQLLGASGDEKSFEEALAKLRALDGSIPSQRMQNIQAEIRMLQSRNRPDDREKLIALYASLSTLREGRLTLEESLRLGALHVAAEDYETALKVYQSLLPEYEKVPEVQAILTVTLTQLGEPGSRRLQEAESHMARLELLAPNRFRTVMIAANLRQKQKRLADAVRELASYGHAQLREQGLKEFDSRDLEAWVNENLQAAMTLLQNNRTQLKVPVPASAISRAQSLVKDGRSEDAAKFVLQLVQLNQAARMVQLETVRAAAEQIEWLSGQASDDPALRPFALAEAERLLKPLSDAALTEAAKLGLAMFYYRQSRIPEGLAECEKRVSDTPVEKVGVMAAMLLRRMETPQPDLAGPWVARVEAELAKNDPARTPALRAVLGDLSVYAENYSSARAQYELRLKSNPFDILALNNLAWLKSRTGENPEEGLQLIDLAIEQATQKNGPLPDLLDTKAIVLIRLGRFEEALQVVAEIKDEKLPGPDFRRAEIYFRQGQLDKARESARLALQKGFNVSGVDSFDQDLAKQILGSDAGG